MGDLLYTGFAVMLALSPIVISIGFIVWLHSKNQPKPEDDEDEM